MTTDKRKKNKKFKLGISNIAIVIVSVYFICVLVQQQGELNSYNQQKKVLATKIQDEKVRKEKLENAKNFYNSDQYVEKIARDKLGLVKLGEKIFYDTSNR